MPDIIAREKEFLKLNEELNKKTHVQSGFHGGEAKRNTHEVSKFSTYTKKGPNSTERFRGGGGGIFGKSQLKQTLPTTPETSDTDKKKLVDNGTYKISRISKKDPLSTPQKAKKEPLKSSITPNPRFPWTFKNIMKKESNVIQEDYRNENFTESPSLDELLGKQSKDTETEIDRKDTASKEVFNSTSRSVKPPNSPEKVAKKNLSNDGLIKFLKSKVAILQEELETSSIESAKKTDELHKTYDKLKKLESQRDQALSKNSTLTDQLAKMEQKFDSLEKQLKEKDLETTSNGKELETMKRELKVTKQANTNLEKRLFRTNEELENLKNTISAFKESERELKDASRVEKDTQEKQIKSLKKQRSDLLEAYKKQLYLIDNLRRQNICLEQTKLLKFGEKELSKVLDWNNKN